MARPSEPLVLGWREWVRLPALRIPAIKAKLDTGARSSALHVLEHEVFERGGARWVRFTVDPDVDDEQFRVEAEARVADERMIRASVGHEEERLIIRTNLEINGVAWPVDLSLASRTRMRFRMLIGREALRGRAIVDPASSYRANHPARRRPMTAARAKEEEE